MKPLCCSALLWTVWPPGRSDSKHSSRHMFWPLHPGAASERTSVLVPLNSAVASKVWTEHLVARTCFSVLSCPRTQTSALPVKPCQQLRRIWSTSPAPSALPVGAPDQHRPRRSWSNLRQQLRRSQSTFASNCGAAIQPRQQLRRSLASNLGAAGQPSPATSVLQVNLRQQLRPFANNFGAPGQPSPATSQKLCDPL